MTPNKELLLKKYDDLRSCGLVLTYLSFFVLGYLLRVMCGKERTRSIVLKDDGRQDGN